MDILGNLRILVSVLHFFLLPEKIRDVLGTCLKLMQSPGRIDIFLVFPKIAIGVGDRS